MKAVMSINHEITQSRVARMEHERARLATTAARVQAHITRFPEDTGTAWHVEMVEALEATRRVLEKTERELATVRGTMRRADVA
jgi:hypothetical protein